MFKNKSISHSLTILVVILLFSYIFLRIVFMVGYYDNKVDSLLETYEGYAQSVSKYSIAYINNIWDLEEVIGIQMQQDPEWISKPEFPLYLKLLANKVGGIDNIAILNDNGDVVSSSDSYINKCFLPEEYLSQIISGKEELITDLEKSSTKPDENTVKIVKAVRLDEKMFIIVSELDLDTLAERIPRLIREKDIHFTLIDHKGVVVYSNKDIFAEGKSLLNEYSVNSAIDGEEIATVGSFSPIDNKRRIGLDFPISEIGWDCRVTSPFYSAMAGFYKQVTFDVVHFVILISFFIFIGFFLKRRIIKPVATLRNAATEMMDGNYSVRTNIKGDDEIALAAETFDKMAESVEQWQAVKNQFFMNMSHEIKTPLNVIFASVQLIDNYKSISDMESYKNKISGQMKIIRQNCYRLMRLTRNLLDISRHDNGFLKMNQGNYDIVKLVRDITNSVKRYAEAKGLNLIFKSEMDSLIIACDPDMIERILLNLISNSLKFTDKGGTITVKIIPKENNLLLTVRDTGIGIPQNKLDCIFERFKQADDPFNRNCEGTGIGLSIVKAFVDAHKGDIWVKSELMKGTEFFISLPVRLVENSEKNGNPKESASNGTTNVISKINIEFSDIYSGIEEENL